MLVFCNIFYALNSMGEWTGDCFFVILVFWLCSSFEEMVVICA